MEHIRQKGSTDAATYTVVITTGYEGRLNEHPSIIEHPETFEVSNDAIPADAQYLNYI